METSTLTVKQQLTLLPKRCLIDRVIVMYCIAFFLLVGTVLFAGLWFRERKMRLQTDAVYKSTIDLDSFRRQNNKIKRLDRLGMPTAHLITKQP